MSPSQAAIFFVGVASALSSGKELHSHYAEIFPSGNRNAASHRWASFILARSASLSFETLSTLFASFCPVSGSPVQASDANRYHYTIKSLAGGTASGYLHHCCTPCICDTSDFLKADTKTIQTAEGAKTLNVVVIGDPCKSPTALARPFTDPFSGESTTLSASAPELTCTSEGRLANATFSDHGGAIVGLLSAVEEGVRMQDSTEFAPGSCRYD